jgi:DNA-binding response OmpR family regulator
MDSKQATTKPPVEKPEEVKKEPSETADQVQTAPPTVEPAIGRILLVEDDLPMVKMYSTKLTKEKFEVMIANDGQQALEKVASDSPDLVVLDLMIPKIGGMEVLAQLRSDPKTKNLPVIILSNLSQDADIIKAKELGVKEFLVKANYTPSQVVEKIKEHLKG